VISYVYLMKKLLPYPLKLDCDLSTFEYNNVLNTPTTGIVLRLCVEVCTARIVVY